MIRIPQYQYIHVMDMNKSVTRLEIGPKMFHYLDHEKIIIGPLPMINLPPRSYCIIKNPIVLNEDGCPVNNDHGEVKVSFGLSEVRVQEDIGIHQFRVYNEPFPLYPYEQIEENVKK